ncbi:hypothetical protein [Xanthomarina gelatinilytica]|uniref:hypothetical protein n=1 Tax=Xanthomarina gelatinilytica TaxID=1137281 RepID=UPI003AA85680
MEDYSTSKLKSLLFRAKNAILTAKMELKEIRDGEETMHSKEAWETILAQSHKEQIEIEKELLLRETQANNANEDDEFLDSIIKG